LFHEEDATRVFMSIIIAITDKDREACMGIRLSVFVEEQKVPAELEADEWDRDALHLLLQNDATGEALATARLVDLGSGTVKIGRVAVVAEYRGAGLGREIMRAALGLARARGFQEAVLTAQTRALGFYEALGFRAEGTEFLEAGIPHFRMRLRLSI
jgi:predicted GNAT family N-acyltransferase